MKISEMSVELIDYMGSDLSVVNAARVSFAKESDWEEQIIDEYNDAPEGWHYDGDTDFSNAFGEYNFRRLSEKDQKLIAYLATHNHWTPFAHAFLSFRIKAPIFVARQLVKHQVGLAWNEVSRRYVDDEPEFWFPTEWRGKPVNAKQGSSEKEIYKNSFTQNDWIKGRVKECADLYEEMLNDGVAPEQARMVLPQNTMTEWIWSGSLAAFARVCKLRLDPHAQQETQEIAKQINNLVPEEFTHSWKALVSDGKVP